MFMIKKQCSFNTEGGYVFSFTQDQFSLSSVYVEARKIDGSRMTEEDRKRVKDYLHDMGKYETYKGATETENFKQKIDLAVSIKFPYVVVSADDKGQTFEDLILGRSYFSLRDKVVVRGNIGLSDVESRKRETLDVPLEEIFCKAKNIRCWRAVKTTGRDVCEEENIKELEVDIVKKKSNELV